MSLLTFLVCLLQTSFLLLIAGMMAGWLRRRDPASAATVGLMGLVGSALLVALTLFGVSRPWPTKISLADPVAADMHRSAGSDSRATASNAVVSEGRRGPAQVDRTADGAALQRDDGSPDRGVSFLGMVARLEAAAGPGGRIDSTDGGASLAWLGRMTHCVFLCTLGLMLLPVLVGIIATIHLHQTARFIERDDSVIPRFTFLFGSEEKRFRVSDWIKSPCVTCYGGKTIYLPSDWALWPLEQLAMAVAHERSHLRRCDPWFRLLGRLCAIVHTVHPVAWWVYRGLTLSQEMAADRNAAEGQSVQYTKSLGRLALRLDAQQYQSSESRFCRDGFRQLLGPGIVSVSSNHLIRRIEMLTMKPRISGKTRLTVTGVLATLVVTIFTAGWTVQADQPPTSKEVEDATEVPASKDQGQDSGIADVQSADLA
ncbi:MAG: M56 family metallopeptidase, partial [Rubripirellula sp.]